MSLRKNIGRTTFGKPIRHCLVAKSKDGNILAGLEATKEYDLRVIKVRRLPFFLNLVNKAIRIVPSDGELRRLIIDTFWFEPGQIEAAVSLWKHARWKWSNECNTLGVSFDKRSPLGSVCKLPFYIPGDKFKIAVKTPFSINKSRLIFPVV